jgi:hypothetical protein
MTMRSTLLTHWPTAILCLSGVAFSFQEGGGCGCMPRAQTPTGPSKAMATPAWGQVRSFLPAQAQAPNTRQLPLARELTRSCFADCPAGAAAGPNCLIGQAPAGPVASGLSLLASTLASQTQIRIDPPGFLRSFQMAMDPCRRGPTVLERNRLVNSGLACTITAPYAPLQMMVQAELPAAFEASVEKQGNVTMLRIGGEGAGLRFMKQGQPTVPHPADARFGGRALAVETDGRMAFARTQGGGCIGAVLPGPAAVR